MAAKPKSMVGVDDLLPPEIWTEILIRVPVKSVLRCRIVCKSWYSFISYPNFISAYSVRNLNKNGNRALIRLQDIGGWSYSSQDESSMEFRVRHDYIPEAFRGPFVEIVGSCNGLICLSNTHNRFIGRSCPIIFLVWNPSIRKIVELPSRTFCARTQRLSYCGFGFDPEANDYKVLRVVGNITNGGFGDAMCEIFDLRKGVWRVICPRAPSSWFIGVGNVQECYLDGAVYWCYGRVLLSFSFSNECFREMEMPNFARSDMNTDLSLQHSDSKCEWIDLCDDVGGTEALFILDDERVWCNRILD